MSPYSYKVQVYSKLISIYFLYVCMNKCVLSKCLKAQSVLQTRTPGGRAFHSFGAIIAKLRNCSMFCCTLLYVHPRIAIILMGKRELIALLNLSSWCLVMSERLFLAVPQGFLQFVIVVFPDHTQLLFRSPYDTVRLLGTSRIRPEFFY